MASPSEVLPLGRELRVRLIAGRDLVLETKAWPGETPRAFAERWADSAAEASRLQEAIAQPGALLDDGYTRIPLERLGGDARAFVLRSVFPEDRMDGADWLHVARKGVLSAYDEGLWQVAAWYAGDGARFGDLLDANGLVSPELSPGQVIRIPGPLLDPGLAPKDMSEDGALAYGRDARGEYAGYRLKPREALYSAVVLRYTGRTEQSDVDTLSRSIAARSGIREMTDIPAGWLVKIPLDALDTEFLPRSDPRRKSRDKAVAAMEKELAARPPPKETAKGLKGIVVILDAGHGGMDPGTMGHGVREHDYVFDVASRLKREMERRGARVYLTIDDPATGAVPSSGDTLPANKSRTVLTTPPFLAEENGETAVAVNLRWYLANSLYRKLVASGTDRDKIVFVSLHADARHPSLRGAMVYVPGASFRTGTMGYASPEYLRFREVREQPRVSFDKRDRVRSEAVSRKLAGEIVSELKRSALPVQPYQPIRERVIRGQEVWLPAVLRGNVVPAKVLVEMVNLNNEDDAELLSRASDRSRLAGALASALADHFRPRSGASARGR